MANVMFLSGSMFGRKSKTMIDLIIDAQAHNVKHLVYKPTTDTRDGLFIRSRDYTEEITAEPWYPALGMKTSFVAKLATEKIEEVFIDEVHFLSVEDITCIVTMCRQFDVNLYLSGLETDFKCEPFPPTKWLRDNCDSYIFHHGKCNSCEKDTAVYNLLFDEKGNRVTEGNSIKPGDSEYRVLCKKCIGE